LIVSVPNARLSLTMAKGKSPKAAQSSTRIAITFQPSYERDFFTAYSNFASISHSNNEFCLDFCLLAPPYQVDTNNKVVITPVIARIIIPPKMVEGLRDALKVELEKQGKEDPETLTVPKP
jgi:Protein of unknown function (DUF3467)